MCEGGPASRAILHVRERAELLRDDARSRARAVLARWGQTETRLDELHRGLCRHARITVNFHPDRLCSGGETVADGLLREGCYRSQFVTGTTNSSPTAYPGGARDRWEEKLFDGAYHEPPAPPEARPTYGAFNVMAHADGASARYGSSYLVLAPSVLSRCTFTWGDSHLCPDQVGTCDSFEPVLTAMLETVEVAGEALGVSGLDVPGLLARLESCAERMALPPTRRPMGRAIDAYVEAQVHKPLTLAEDVESIVMDPCFEGTPAGRVLERVCARYGCELQLHPGFALHADDVGVDDEALGSLAARVARAFTHDGVLDAAALGRAAHALQARCEGRHGEDVHERLLRLWHVLVRRGEARGRRRSSRRPAHVGSPRSRP